MACKDALHLSDNSPFNLDFDDTGEFYVTIESKNRF